MTDPRELGLPPVGPAPSFAPSLGAMESSRRRFQHRRRTRTAFTGAAAAALAAAVFAAQLGEGSTSVLEQELQPADPRTTQVTADPTGATDSLEVPPTPLDEVSGAEHGVGLAARSGGSEVPGAANPPPAYDATPWRRAGVAAGWKCGTTSVTEWTPTGWCFDASMPAVVRAGHRTRLDIRVCRTGVERRELQFATRQQAVVHLFDPKTRRVLWSSAERPSPFVAGERLLVKPGRCVQWTTVWNVRTDGRPIAPGAYQYRWTTGTGLTSPTGTTDSQLQAVKVVAR